MSIDTEITNQLRGVQRASNQFGEPYYILSSETKAVAFTGSALPTGAFTLPTGSRGFLVYNNTSAPVTVYTGTLVAASPNMGVLCVQPQADKYLVFEDQPVECQVSYCLCASAPTLGTLASALSYSGGSLFVTPVRP